MRRELLWRDLRVPRLSKSNTFDKYSDLQAQGGHSRQRRSLDVDVGVAVVVAD